MKLSGPEKKVFHVAKADRPMVLQTLAGLNIRPREYESEATYDNEKWEFRIPAIRWELVRAKLESSRIDFTPK
jgi:hypothetical protein